MVDRKEFEIKNRMADGDPKTFSICRHSNANGNWEFYVGANMAG